MFRFGLSLFVWTTLVVSVSAIFPPSGPYRVDRSISRRLREPSAYTDLGGVLSSSPNCLSRDGRESHCFFVTEGGSVSYASIKNGEGAFEDLGGSVTEQPQTVGYGQNGVLAFFMTPDEKLAVAAVQTNTELDKKITVLDFGTFLEAPGCVTLEGDDTVFCVIRATNGGMHTFKFERGLWVRPQYVTDNPNGPVSCALNKVVSRIHCWSTDDADVLAERLFSGTGLPDSPIWASLYQRARGRVAVYVLRVTPLPRALAYRSNKMIDIFGDFGGNLQSEPDCANADSRSLDCFALDVDGGIQRNYQLMGVLYVRRTSGWVHYGGSFKGKPSCHYMSGDRKFHCFIRSDKDSLVEGLFTPFDTPRAAAT